MVRRGLRTENILTLSWPGQHWISLNDQDISWIPALGKDSLNPEQASTETKTISSKEVTGNSISTPASESCVRPRLSAQYVHEIMEAFRRTLKFFSLIWRRGRIWSRGRIEEYFFFAWCKCFQNLGPFRKNKSPPKQNPDMIIIAQWKIQQTGTAKRMIIPCQGQTGVLSLVHQRNVNSSKGQAMDSIIKAHVANHTAANFFKTGKCLDLHYKWLILIFTFMSSLLR